MNKDKSLGKRLKEFRIERGMTQPKAALHFGVSFSTICRLEAGKGCGDLIRAKIERGLQQEVQAA